MFGPAYAAILPALVGRTDLPGAISLNSAQMNASRVIGPVIGSVAYHFVGPAWVFAGNAATYLFVIGSLMVVTLPPSPTTQHASRWRELTAGVSTARADVVVGRCLITVFLFSLLALAFIGQMPVVASHNLGINPKSANYGFSTPASAPAPSSAPSPSARSSPARPSRLIVRVCLLGYSVALAGFALLREAIVPAYFVVALVGAFYFAFITALNTTLQSRLDDGVRGRVMALWIMGFGGTVALGNLLAGPVVSAVGITSVLLFGAGVALLLCLVRRRPGTPCSGWRARAGLGPVGVAQLLLVELPVLTARQLLGEVDRSGALVVREVARQ
jgi:MFS family permease